MTYYLAIDPQQEPNDLGTLDDAGRVQYVFNVVATSRPTRTFLQELVRALEAASVGVEGVNIFAGSLAVIPAGPGPYLHVRSTGGVAPLGTHNDGAGAYRRPGAQFIIRAATLAAAENMAQAAYDALLAVRNQAVVA